MMTTRTLIASAVLISLSCFATTARAAAPKDPFGPRGSWTTLLKSVLLNNKVVQKELRLTKEQQVFAGRLKPAKDDNVARIEKTLDAKQLIRLKQMSWQARGGYVLFEREVAEALRITDTQQDKLAAAAKVNAAEYQKMRDFLRRARFASREAMENFIAGYRNAADKRLLDVLTAGQHKLLNKMLGPKLQVR